MQILNLARKAIFSPSKIPHAAKIELRSLREILRNGLPDIMLQFLGGIGDELLLTAVAHELKKRNPDLRIWQVSHSAELLYQNPDYSKVFDWNYWSLRYSKMLNGRRCHLSYSEQIVRAELEKPPARHIIAELCRKAGVKGEIAIRPYLFLTKDEKKGGRLADSQIVLHCAGEGSYENVMRNKIWPKDKFESLVRMIKEERIGGYKWEIVQLGSDRDPPLAGCLDLRGKTSLRQTAAVISQSDVFIGTSGFLAHLARAVDTRSVVIYGGREHSYQSGYLCNENLNSFIECAPCWRWNGCDHDRECMKKIQATDVLNAFQRLSERRNVPLETETILIDAINSVEARKVFKKTCSIQS